MKRKFTELEKKLIAMSSLGIWIEHDSHTWIMSAPTDDFDFMKTIEVEKIKVKFKVYDGINEALIIIDTVLAYTNKKSLLNVFQSIEDLYQENCEKTLQESLFCE